MQQFFLMLSIFCGIFATTIEASQAGCTEVGSCPPGWYSKKNCGTWWCYRDYPNMPMEWRGYWGVTHVCEWTWPGSFAVSIHCKEENDFTRDHYWSFFIGLYIPEGIPWHPLFFRWTDGTPVDFTDWTPPMAGNPFQQPHNEVPTERVVDFNGHWFDTISNNPVTHRILCKRKPDRIITTCPTTIPPPPTPTTTTTPPTTTTTLPPTPKVTQGDIIMETPPQNEVPGLPPGTPKPTIRSCRI